MIGGEENDKLFASTRRLLKQKDDEMTKENTNIILSLKTGQIPPQWQHLLFYANGKWHTGFYTHGAFQADGFVGSFSSESVDGWMFAPAEPKAFLYQGV